MKSKKNRLAVNNPTYIGRFAPSPTGAAHFGTLLAAMASYLQARINQGIWLLRIEDIDATRKQNGADTALLNTLEKHGFIWDGEPVYQSSRIAYYQHALQQLSKQSLIFPCTCSRKQLAKSAHTVYPGFCRHKQLPESRPHALRLRCLPQTISFSDKIMGSQTFHLATDCGDFIVKRRDHLFAYQLAVTVDDALQGITEVVRGADLLPSTPKQIYLQQLLDYPQPDYFHIPLAVDKNGHKFNKSTGAARIENSLARQNLIRALDFLGQQPPADLVQTGIDDIWHWAENHWEAGKIPRHHRQLCRR